MLRSETDGDLGRLAAALAGLRAYQQGPRLTRPSPAPTIAAAAGRARLLDYGGTGAPVVLVPSLVNGSEILDLDDERSLLRWLATQGVRPLLVDWGRPSSADRDLDIAGHVETFLLPLLDAIGEPSVLVGYCLGGTMALGAAARRRMRGVALIATPWRFAGFPDEARAALEALWHETATSAEAIGLLPMEVLQTAFWRLDPARSVAKFVAFGARAGDEQAARAFIAVEDWANDGPPLPLAAARELIHDFFGRDRTGAGQWRVGGTPVDPAALDLPIFEIVSTTDRIVPAAAALGIGERLPLSLGHVGMIVGGRARPAVWEPLAAWLSRVAGGC